MRPLQTQSLINKPANASITSAPIDARQLFSLSLQAVSSAGSLAGTVQLQVTNQPCLGPFNDYAPSAVQWTNLGTALTFAQSSAAISQISPRIDLSYVAVRVVYSDTSGGTNTASLTVNIMSLGQ